MNNDQDRLISNPQNPQVFVPIGTSSQQQPQQAQQTDENAIQRMFKTSSHPKVLFFHLLFRTASVIIFLLMNIIFSKDVVSGAITVLLLLASDFWVVKNLSGRLLVGLRWWNTVDDNGISSWKFEAKPRDQINKADSNIFWGSLYLFAVIWAVFIFVEIITFNFLGTVLAIVAFSLNSANVVGYSKCDRSQQEKLQGMVTQGIMSGIMKNTFGSWVR